MKNKIGICFLTVIAILLALFILEKINTRIKQSEQKETGRIEIADDSEKNMKENLQDVSKDISVNYMVYNENGMLTVYSNGGSEKFFDSGIYYDELPADIQQKIDSGYGFESEADLYDFLESYSS